MAEAFFARLPPSRLTALETELRDLLLKAAAVAERLLPRAGTVALQETRGYLGRWSSPRRRRAWSRWRLPEAPKALRPQFPVKPVAKASAAPPSGSTAAAEAFFSRLPHDSFTQTEEALRSALKALLAERGPLPVSQAAAEPAVASAAKATLIRAVTLADWVERRIGGEVQAVLDEKGGRVLQLARHDKSRGRGSSLLVAEARRLGIRLILVSDTLGI
ncbi:unnamed protein product [Prorocentrum cordatum]|uniref:Uncharacterized protein n=1 Tax=Prorocentrum cordatum TaxID=2364126 RepID=A0ABN9PG79_9DINO|nr:unnamed protein product [Polarella glacialis]